MQVRMKLINFHHLLPIGGKLEKKSYDKMCIVCYMLFSISRCIYFIYCRDARSNPLVGMNPIRIQFMTQVVNNFQPLHNTPSNNVDDTTTASSPHLPLRNKRILDIGCGGGLLTESLSRLGASLVVGVDASTKVVEVAKRHSFHNNSMLLSSDSVADEEGEEEGGNNKIRYIGGVTVEELATNWLSKNKEEQQSSSTTPNNNNDHELFDIITALEIIEHVPNPTSLLHSASSLLKPNGILFVSTINRTLKSYSIAIVGAEYITGKVPIGTHDWNTFWSPEEVERMIVSESGSNMKQIAANGMVIEPPFVTMKWSLDDTDTDVNWVGAYQKNTNQKK